MPAADLTRRRFLRAAGVTMALPWLECTAPVARAASAAVAARRRVVAICYPVGMHAPFFFPQGTGRGYELSRYLKEIADFRNDFTVFSGLSHARILRSHSCDKVFLTGATYEQPDAFKNTISLDQLAAAHIGDATRYATLNLGTGLSWTQNGVQQPGFNKPSEVFARLFLSGSASQMQQQARRLRDGQSIMDMVGQQANDFRRDLGAYDRQRLDEYCTSVREVERRLVAAQEWEKRPKPTVNVPPPKDVSPISDPFGHLRLLYDLVHLALQTDSTRIITLHGGLLGSQPIVNNVTMDYHNLSHHGMDPQKIAGVGLIETELMKVFNHLLTKLKQTSEDGQSLLDRTMVLLGSNLGNASSHDTTNLPIFLAGGGFKHGEHLVFSRENNVPLCNLYVSMLQRLGIDAASFGTSKGTLTGLNS